jgi:hypothetical protein
MTGRNGRTSHAAAQELSGDCLWLGSEVRLEKRFTRDRSVNPGQFTEERIAEMVAGVAVYFSGERKLYFPDSAPLAAEWRTMIEPYFSQELLDKLRIVVLQGARIPPPPFYAEALAMTGGRFPDFVHMASVTYVDVIVFNERIESRALFHGTVHAVQIDILGFETYVDLYLRGFLKNLSWMAIPLEDQAYKLDARFAEAPRETFSVEEEIRQWMEQGKYESVSESWAEDET